MAIGFSDFLEFIAPTKVARTATAPTRSLPQSLRRSSARIACADRRTAQTTGSRGIRLRLSLPECLPVRCSTIASGKIRTLDASTAAKAGVLGCCTMEISLRSFGLRQAGEDEDHERRPPFEMKRSTYWGQYVAVVVAETFQQAQARQQRCACRYDATSRTSPLAGRPDAGVGAPDGPKGSKQARRRWSGLLPERRCSRRNVW